MSDRTNRTDGTHGTNDPVAPGFMKLGKLIEYLRNHLKTVVRICLAVLVLLVIGDYFLVDKEHHAHTKPEHWFGFWSVFGFVACAVIVLVSKWYGHAGIMTREDYYDE